MKKIVVRAAVVLFAMVFACGVAIQVDAKVKVKSVTVRTVTGSKKVVYVAKGKKVKLTTNVTVAPNSVKNQKVIYKSDNKAVVTVSSKGVIKGKKIGNAKVTVQSKKNKSKKATIKVRVVYPVKKVRISNNNTALCVDNSKILTAKVTGTKKRNFCKIVQWTTSNKRVAIVSAGGTVKAVGVGTATITAKAVDGTGKKASCRVKVAPRKTSIMAISFNSYYNRSYTNVVRVSLNQAKALKESDFSIMTKSCADAQYTKVERIASVITKNNKDYYITLNEDLYSGEYVQVSINALDGAKTKGQRFMTSSAYLRMTMKANKDYYFTYDIDDIAYNSTMKIDSGILPKGLAYNAKDNVISGAPSAITKNQICKVSIKDEMGRVIKYEFNFIVGDSKNIVAGNRKIGDIKGQCVLPGYNYLGSVEACGGSGSYTYNMENSCNSAFKVNSSGYVWLDSDTIKPGTYNPVIRVFDKADNTIYTDTTWSIVVTKGAQVTVKLALSSDQYTYIYFRNKETGYERYLYARNDTQKLTVEPGTYDVYYLSTSSDGTKRCNYLSKDLSVTKDTTLNYKISNIFNIICHLKDADGNNYNVSNGVSACMFNSADKCVGTDYGNSSLSFNWCEPGKYYIYFYDKITKQLIGKTGSFTLNGGLELTVNLDKKNPA